VYVAAEGNGLPGLWEKRGFEKVGTCVSGEIAQTGKCTNIAMYRKTLK
jgi:hypothetical protein